LKRNLLLLHGALGSKAQLSDLKNKLKDQYSVFNLNFDGHGGRTCNQEFSIELFSNNVIQFLEQNSIQKVSIFGYSMGGYVALKTALNLPNKVDQIITLGTKFDWSLESAKREIKMLDPNKVQEKVPVFAQRLAELHQPLKWQEVMLKTAQMMLKMAEGVKLTDNDFKQIRCPVTLGLGDQDQMVSLEESKHIQQLIPNCNFKSLENTKHPIDSIPTNLLFDYVNSNLI